MKGTYIYVYRFQLYRVVTRVLCSFLELLANRMTDSSQREFQKAKAFLLTSSDVSNLNLYDHLSACLKRLLQERPNNAADLLEDVSRRVKREKMTAKTDTLVDEAAPNSEAAIAEVHRGLFIPALNEEQERLGEEDAPPPYPNLLELVGYFEQGGVGIGRTEAFRIFLALKQLTEAQKLQSVRFWGKVFGTERNYVVAECEFVEGEGMEEDTGEKEQAPETGETEAPGGDEEGQEDKEDLPPKSNYKPPPVIPREEFGTGTNKKVYFVCNDAGDVWTRLPPVTPAQLVAARQIRKFLTGDLSAKVLSYPPFPGNEGNYLRAQIARISASTHISPGNYFQFDADEDDEMDARDTFAVNEEFESIPVQEMVDESLSRWVHHVQFILPQGRCLWHNPLQKPDDQFEDDDDDDEDKEEPDEPTPEEGPPLLTPLSEDREVDGMPSWSPGLSSTLVPNYAIAVIHSNLWPGASAFCINKTFENVYIGWGQKYSSQPLNPLLPPSVQDEYPEGPDILEAEDPTVEQETLLRVAQEGKLGEGEDEEPEDDDEDQ